MRLPVFARTRDGLPSTTALLRALVEALATLLAAIATMLCTWVAAPGPGPAVLAVVLCLSLSRSQLDRDLRGRLEAAVVLPLVGLVALGVGLLLRHWPWAGAAVFVAGMFVSIWLRRFGAMARRAGGLIALPFVTLLTVPHVQPTANGVLPVWLVPIVVALLALFWVSMLHLLVRRLRIRPPVDEDDAPIAIPATQDRPGLAVSTRMAIQMAVALAVSFALGFLFFRERWGWIVLTAFIVNSGNRGRLDVVYKSGMRVLGAAVGTAIALGLGQHLGVDRHTSPILMLTALFLGVWLRPFGYAWWALFVTLALALLQGFGGGEPTGLLWQRMEEIVLGAIVGIAAAWWVLPVRSTDVLRRRLADALAALSEALDPATEQRSAARFTAALDRVEEVTPPFRAARLLLRRRAMHPADWADTLLDCREPAKALIDQGATPGRLRQAVGAARRALREPDTLLPLLRALRADLRSG
ncbi:Fusaric acid resistance protein-like [Dyella marensis]|uniref:Fusaric acid resistance protein-like n=1 Tax=Dyella marensis TaxID=500610 RepID=A0A1I2J2J7_9GAMM|nr:FUSC family protein [Dyella marensis]SFF48895.1 Fusaric acid resistance protein-like [Dyella marensis]